MKKLQLKVINPVPNIDLLSLSLISDGMQSPLWKRYFGFYFSVNYSTFDHDFLNWYNDLSFWQKFGQAAFNRISRDSAFSTFLYQKHKVIGTSLFKLCDEILKTEIQTLSNRQIRSYLARIFELYRNFCTWGFIPVVIDLENNYLSSFLEKITSELTGKYRIGKPVQEIISLLAAPRELTFDQQEKIDLLRLAAQAKVAAEDLERHHQHYQWIDYGYLGPAHPLSYYRKRLDEFRKNKKSTHQMLLALQRNRHRALRHQKRLSKQLHLDAKTKYLFRVAGDFMFLKVYRQQLEFMAIFAYDLLFKELGKRFHLTLKQFHYASPEEVLQLLEGGKIDRKQINRRIKSFFTRTHLKGQTRFYYGQPAHHILRGKIVKENIDTSIKEFRGMAAFLGKVRGVVKIVNVKEDMDKVKRGDILVSISTNPAIVPAMKKAAAFVTDTGGITCHAAIVAREMKKPCIIGTKIATKILEDGDQVEVDADHGKITKS